MEQDTKIGRVGKAIDMLFQGRHGKLGVGFRITAGTGVIKVRIEFQSHQISQAVMIVCLSFFEFVFVHNCSLSSYKQSPRTVKPKICW